MNSRSKNITLSTNPSFTHERLIFNLILYRSLFSRYTRLDELKQFWLTTSQKCLSFAEIFLSCGQDSCGQEDSGQKNILSGIKLKNILILFHYPDMRPSKNGTDNGEPWSQKKSWEHEITSSSEHWRSRYLSIYTRGRCISELWFMTLHSFYVPISHPRERRTAQTSTSYSSTFQTGKNK